MTAAEIEELFRASTADTAPLRERITELEAALRDLIAMIDPIYDLEPVDRDAFYKAKAALERR